MRNWGRIETNGRELEEFAGEIEASQALEQAKRGFRDQGRLVGIP